MNLENSRHNLRVLSQVVASGEKTILKTPSGKFKEDTVFERTIGCGKKLFAAIQGRSYDMKRLDFERAKEEVEAKLRRQIHFFSKIKDIKIYGNSINHLAKKIINEKIGVENSRTEKNFGEFNIFRFAHVQEKYDSGLDEEKKLNNDEKSIKSKIKNQLLDEKYFQLKTRINNEKIYFYEIDTTTLDDIASIAADLIEKQGQTTRNAIILARLMKSDELVDVSDQNVRYNIAKKFSDSYLLNQIKEKMTHEEFSEALKEIKNQTVIHQDFDDLYLDTFSKWRNSF